MTTILTSGPERRRKARVCRDARGFTLMELMIVMLIMSILIGMAAIAYDKTVKRARESVLKQDLQTMRQA
ncbi:MAG TPA: prepilin-type N-terminal cleavage/methylation domain-containing protein, partial [Candidatus Acidoferrum sp.]